MRHAFISWLGLIVLVFAWDFSLRLSAGTLLPSPWQVLQALMELAANGLLIKHLAASLFRVTWGFLAAALLALPVGLTLALYRSTELAFTPFLELLRPISPLAWIPIAILWFGVGDLSAVALIFIASFLPLTLSVRNAVRGVPVVSVQAGRNFGLSRLALVRKVLLPAMVPQLLVGARLALGIAWLVVVAAEMIAVNSGLGFLIVDARNAGNRYDLVVAGMVMIGLVGLGLDAGMRRLEKLPGLAWGYAGAGGED